MISRRGEASTLAASRSKRALMLSSPIALLGFIRRSCFSTKADVTDLRENDELGTAPHRIGFKPLKAFASLLPMLEK